MSHAQSEDGSIVLHHGRAYDLVFGWAIRRSDLPILEHARVDAGDRVLDIGTGPGYLAQAASRLVGPGGIAVGIDASPEMVERARLLAGRAGSMASYQVASAASLPFEDGSFDVVVSRLVFHHLTGELKIQALAEAHRVLGPGGRLLIADLASRMARGAHHLAAHVLGTDPEPADALERLVWDAGFRDVTHGPLLHGLLSGVAARRPEDGQTRTGPRRTPRARRGSSTYSTAS